MLTIHWHGFELRALNEPKPPYPPVFILDPETRRKREIERHCWQARVLDNPGRPEKIVKQVIW